MPEAELNLDVLLVAIGGVTAVVSLCGDTWDKERRRFTRTGWSAFGLALLTGILGTVNQTQHATRERSLLWEVTKTQRSLENAERMLDEARGSLNQTELSLGLAVRSGEASSEAMQQRLTELAALLDRRPEVTASDLARLRQAIEQQPEELRRLIVQGDRTAAGPSGEPASPTREPRQPRPVSPGRQPAVVDGSRVPVSEPAPLPPIGPTGVDIARSRQPDGPGTPPQVSLEDVVRYAMDTQQLAGQIDAGWHHQAQLTSEIGRAEKEGRSGDVTRLREERNAMFSTMLRLGVQVRNMMPIVPQPQSAPALPSEVFENLPKEPSRRPAFKSDPSRARDWDAGDWDASDAANVG